MTLPNDNIRDIRDLLRRIFQEAGVSGEKSTVIVNMTFVINPGGTTSDNGCQAVKETIEPKIEIHRIGDEIKIVTSLPGISHEHIRLAIVGPHLVIRGEEGDLNYYGSVEVPVPQKDSIQISFRHGVLEIGYREMAPGTDQAVRNGL
jgi:HSP20 family molecular chaperone IbpA